MGAGGEGAGIEQSENANAGAGTCVRERMRVGFLQSIGVRRRGSGEWEWLGTRADPIELLILRESNISAARGGACDR